jgi:hypothetical protein
VNLLFIFAGAAGGGRSIQLAEMAASVVPTASKIDGETLIDITSSTILDINTHHTILKHQAPIHGSHTGGSLGL